jgi:CheY-like chemotaxis protein
MVIVRLSTTKTDRHRGAAAVPVAGKSTQLGQQRLVLLVDDDLPVRKSGAHTLESLGYRVVLAEDGREGVARFQAHHDSLGVVLLDMVMPKMGGQAAFEAMRAIDDHVPIILCSGYAADAAVREMLEQGLAGFLPKPYRLAQLEELLTRVVVVSMTITCQSSARCRPSSRRRRVGPDSRFGGHSRPSATSHRQACWARG